MYLAERDPQHHGWPSRGVGDAQIRLLLSYHYYQRVDLDAMLAKYFIEPYPDIFLDSGAFSAERQGVSIDIDAYMAYIRRYRHRITTYANLDVMRNPEATWRNQQIMEDAGLAPLPVFHGGTEWRWLDHYLDRYRYIALGGLVGKVGKAQGWIVECFRRARGRAVFHGFGVTAWEVLRDLPWYSVDSSSWGQGYRFGQVPVWVERMGAFVKIALGDRRTWLAHAADVRALGYDPHDFADRSRVQRADVCGLSAMSYVRAEQWLRRRHGDIHIPHVDTGLGVRLHLADTSNGINLGDAHRQVTTRTGLPIHLADGSGGGNNHGYAYQSIKERMA